MRILITGFEPFGESRVNPSERLVECLTAREIPGIDLRGHILPVDTQRAPAELLAVLESIQPQAVICLGEAARRARVSIERVAVNLLDFAIPDNSGELRQDLPVVPGGPDAYFATLPVRRLHDALRAAGLPVELSLSAGAYLCNQVMYTLLHHLHTRGREAIPAGFIHLPLLPEQAAGFSGPPAPSMSIETAAQALQVILQELALAD